MTEPLTPTERKVYHYLIDFLAENTYQPSIREIGRKFRIKSRKTVSDLLHSLSEKGYIQRDPSRSRGVRIVGYGGPTQVQMLRCDDDPLAGQVAVDRRFVVGEGAFTLRMRGDELRGRGVLDGDTVVISPTAVPHSDDLVAVRFGGETSVRLFASVDAASSLLAAIPDIGPVASGFTVLGTVTGVLRTTLAPTSLDAAIPE